MTTKSYIVDVWIEDDTLTQQELDSCLSEAFETALSRKELKTFTGIAYDINLMSEDESEISIP